MLNLQEEIKKDIAEGVREAFGKKAEGLEVVVNVNDNVEHGDYASPVAMQLAKKLKKKPLDIVAEIVEAMPKREYIGKIEAAEPGFLNVKLNVGWMVSRLDDVVEQADLCDDISVGRGESINLEFISANPTGPLTFGNLRTGFSVDTLANVLSCAGYNVTREYYVNDAGGQIVKLGESVIRRALQAQGGKVDYAEDLYQGEYIKDVAYQVSEDYRENEAKEFEEQDLEDNEVVFEVGQKAAESLLANIKKTLSEDLKIEFDVWASEKEIKDRGLVDEVVADLKKKKVTKKKDDAVYLKTTKFGDSEDRVLVKSDGEYAYIAPDIAYHKDKYERGFDEIYDFFGADHQGHGPKLKAAMEALGYDPDKLNIVTAQWLRFVRDGKPVKLSKRKGEIWGPQELVAEVGYDAARWFMLQHALTTHMDFDLDLAKEKNDKNPVYYVQYAHVRLQSILRKAKEVGAIAEIGDKIALASDTHITHTTEIKLMREIYKFSEVMAGIAETHQVQALTYYAHDLARAVHSFYKHVSVLGEEDEEVRMSRLQLVVAAKKVLAKTLDLAGISKPDVM